MNESLRFNEVEGIEIYPGKDNRKVVDVKTSRAMYRGKKYSILSNFERGKFENLLVLHDPKSHVLVLYDGQERWKGNPK